MLGKRKLAKTGKHVQVVVVDDEKGEHEAEENAISAPTGKLKETDVTYYMYIRWLYSDFFPYPINGLLDFSQLRQPC